MPASVGVQAMFLHSHTMLAAHDILCVIAVCHHEDALILPVHDDFVHRHQQHPVL